MRLFGLLLLLNLVATAGLAFYNWHIFITPTDVSFGFTNVNVPLGLIMLGLLIFSSVIFLINLVYLQSTALLETRRHTRELEANRKLIDKAEASRFTELHEYLENELSKQSVLEAELKSELFERVDLFESNIQVVIAQAENSLFAYIGELEDRLEKTNKFLADEK